MKRGRPSKGWDIRKAILVALENSTVPLTTSVLARAVSEKSGSKVSWNTVQKYLRELVEANRVQPIGLPHSKKPGEMGLTVYTLKK
jgi:hypothetical protein